MSQEYENVGCPLPVLTAPAVSSPGGWEHRPGGGSIISAPFLLDRTPSRRPVKTLG